MAPRHKRNPPPLRFWEPKPPTWRQRLRRVWRWLQLVLLVAVVAGIALYQWTNRPPPVIEGVAEQFTRCGYGRGHGCVVDGDTFRIGDRTIRVAGIDAAELAGQCPAETARAEASTRALQDWLNRGPFTIVAEPGEPRDKYARELVSVTRVVAGGEERLEEYMTREGGAQRYDGGARAGGVDCLITRQREGSAKPGRNFSHEDTKARRCCAERLRGFVPSCEPINGNRRRIGPVWRDQFPSLAGEGQSGLVRWVNTPLRRRGSRLRRPSRSRPANS